MVDEIGIVNGLIIEYLRWKGAPYVDMMLSSMCLFNIDKKIYSFIIHPLKILTK